MIGFVQSARIGHSQPFHQPILRSAEAPLDAPFGLRRMRRNPDDVQLSQGAADLRRWQLLALVARANSFWLRQTFGAVRNRLALSV